MPSATKMASFHSSSVSPRRKTRHASTYPSATRHSPNPHPTPTCTQSPRLSMSSGATTTTTSSVPTLPDVHCVQSQSGPQWTFLHTLLSQDREEERERGERGGQDKVAAGSRHTTTDSDGDSGDKVSKDFSSGESGNKGNSGGGNNKPGVSDGVVRRITGRSSLPGNASHRSSGSTGNATVWRKHQEQSSHSQRRNLNLADSSQGGVLPSQYHSPLRSGPKTNVTEDKRGANRDVDCMDAENENTRLIHIAMDNCNNAEDREDNYDADENNNNSNNEEEDDNDEEEDDDVAWHPQRGTRPSHEDSSSSRVGEGCSGPDTTSSTPQRGTRPSHEDSSSSRVGEGCFGPDTTSSTSRAPSPSSRRKRPLLLPPIMLPPIYSVQPTPLLLRDDVYFATLGPRARGRPLSDAEWDRLRDCRYLRIRTRPLKA